MRSGAPSDHVGYVHEAAIYDSPDELLQVVVPHLQDAIAAGEPAFASLPDDEAALVRRAMGGASGATFLPARGPRE